MFTNIEGEWDQVMGVIKAAVDMVAAKRAAGERRHQDRSPSAASTTHCTQKSSRSSVVCVDAGRVAPVGVAHLEVEGLDHADERGRQQSRQISSAAPAAPRAARPTP